VTTIAPEPPRPFSLDGHPATAAEVEAAWQADYPIPPLPDWTLACGCKHPARHHCHPAARCRVHGPQAVASYGS
jgi:hypothetical protein